MNYRLICFDVDGTLVETASGATFRKSADDWQWLPGRLEQLRKLSEEGANIALATNQGGVAFGYMQEDRLTGELHRMFRETCISERCVYVCFTHPKATLEQYRADDIRRKPGPGMLQEAMSDFGVEPEETLFVGDRPEDEQAAQAAGCDFQWSDNFFAA